LDDSGPAVDGAETVPRLEFRLPGVWEQFATGGSSDTAVQIKDYVERLVGKADEHAHLRAGLRARFAEGIRAAQKGSAQSLFVCREIAPGVATPVVMTVYAPTELRMSPAVGTSPEVVMAAYKEARAQLYRETSEDWADLAIPGSQILRTVQAGDVALHPRAPDATIPNLQVDYWYTTPGSKNIVLVDFFTPLADIRSVMLEFLDSIVRASRFAE
jgi:hypothetical protein